MTQKNIVVSISLVLIMAFAPLSFADWFTSSETKELITKADAGDMEAVQGGEYL